MSRVRIGGAGGRRNVRNEYNMVIDDVLGGYFLFGYGVNLEKPVNY